MRAAVIVVRNVVWEVGLGLERYISSWIYLEKADLITRGSLLVF